MNEQWTDEVLAAIVEFESSSAASVEVVQSKLQSILTVWEGRTTGPEYDAIDLAENALEEILHARLLAEQREAALDQLRQLRIELVAARP